MMPLPTMICQIADLQNASTREMEKAMGHFAARLRRLFRRSGRRS